VTSKAIFFVALCFLAIVATVLASDGLKSDEEISKMKMGPLKTFLQERGVSCHGCSEKADYVAEAIKHKHLPPTESSSSAPSSSSSSSSPSTSSEDSPSEQTQDKEKPSSYSSSSSSSKKPSKPSSSSSSSSKPSASSSSKKSSSKDSKPPRKEKETLQSAWQLKTVRMCNQKAKSQKIDDEVGKTFCNRLGKLVGTRFSSMSQGLFSALGKSSDKTLQLSMSEPFKTAGESNLRSMIGDGFAMLKENEYDHEKIDEDKLGEVFTKSKMSKWLLDVMMDKKENMFGGDDLESMIRKMKMNPPPASPPSPPPSRSESKKKQDDEYEEHMEL